MTSALYVQTRKEVRALLPCAVGVGLATVALGVWAAQPNWLDPTYQRRMLGYRLEERTWALVVYAAGLLTVAALSIGQEITHRTLPALLVQPVDRRRVLWMKMAVLAVIVSALGVVAELTLPRESIWAGGGSRALLVWGPPVMAVGLVPLLTLLTRRPLGGVVFAVVIPGFIFLVTERLNPLFKEPQAMTVAWYGTLIASAIGLAALAYVFPRVETAGDDPPAAAWSRRRSLPEAERMEVAARAVPSKRSWLWLTVKNELRLQQLTLVVSGLFVFLGGIVVLLQRSDSPYTGPGVGTLATLHGLFIAVVAGSRASAEERHLGVLPSQALQPKAAWRPWAVKVTITLGLALALSVALPWLFRFVDADRVLFTDIGGTLHQGSWSDRHPADWWFGLELAYFAGVVLTTIAALYVSSLNSNSLWALLACFPTGAAIAALFGSIVVPMRFWLIRLYFSGIETLVTPAMRTNYRDPGWRIYFAKLRSLDTVERDLLIILTIGLSLLLLYLASRNHRSLERGRAVVIRQIGVIALYLAVATALFAAAGRVAWWLG